MLRVKNDNDKQKYRAAIFSRKYFCPMLATSGEGVGNLRADEGGDGVDGRDGRHVELQNCIGGFHD